MRDFYNPAFCSLLRVTLEFAGLLPTALDMRNVAMRLNDRQRRCTGVAGIGAQVFVPSDWRAGSVYDDGVEYRFQLRDIMPIGSGRDERQRDATTVHQQMAFAPIFFPYRWDWIQQSTEPAALSSSPRR